MGQGRLVDDNRSLPSWLKTGGSIQKADHNAWRPLVASLTNDKDVEKFKKQLADKPIFQVIDNYDEQIAELFVSRNPQLYQSSYEVKKASLVPLLKEHYGTTQPWKKGRWVYYPWSGRLIHTIEEALFWEARTIRNRDLMTMDEQQKFRDFRAGFAGMSVGSNAAIATVLESGSEYMKIADNAVISGSNLNRIISGISEIGEQKSTAVARRLYEMNPYITIEKLDDNIDQASIEAFFTEPWPLEVVIDEIDDLKIKILLRVEAKKRRIPVIMVTDLGDDVMLDVERYDLDPNLPLFHGLAGDIETLLDREVSRREWLKYATQIINTKNVPLIMQKSLLKIGRSLVTQPQLGGTAMTAGAVIAFAIRQLALGGELKSGRTIASFEKIFLNNPWPRSGIEHRAHTKKVKRILGSL